MAPSHVDLSVLWVPIMPETSKLGEQMEQVGQDATESFGKGSSGIGDKIHESVTKSRDKIKDVFHRTGSDAGKSMSDAFKEETKAVEDAASDAGTKASGKFKEKAKDLGKELVGAIGPDIKRELGSRVEDVVGGAFKMALGNDGVGKQISEAIGGAANQGLTSWIGDIQKKLGDTKSAADTARKAFADFGNGDTTGGVSKLLDGVNKLGIGVKDLPGPVQDAIGKFNEAKNTAQGFADIFNGLPGKIGEVGKAIEGLAGPLAVALQASQDIDYEIRRTGDGALIDARGKGMDKYSQAIADGLSKLPGVHAHAQGVGPSGVDMGGVGGLGRGGDVLGSSADAYDAFSSGALLPTSAPLPNGGWFGGGGRTPGSAGAPAISGSGLPNVRGAHEDLAYIFASIKEQFPWAQLTAGKDDHPVDGGWHPKGQALDIGGGTAAQQAQLSNWLVQFAPQIEELIHQGPGDTQNVKSGRVTPAIDMQGSVYNTGQAGYHGDHIHLAVKDAMGQALYGAMSGGGALPPGAAGSSPSDLFAGGMGGRGGTTATGDKIPTGAQHDPLYVMPSDNGGGPAGGGAGGDSSSLAQQLGSGLIGGVGQSLGLDGSVFKTFSGASNPMDFGITKIGTGLLNWAAGMLPAMSGHGSPKVQQPGSVTNNVDQSFNLTQHGVQGDGSDAYKAAMNSSNRTDALAANMPGS